MEKCQLCGNTQFRTKFMVSSYPILCCLGCGLVMTDKRGIPRRKTNQELYSSKQYKQFYLAEPTKKLLKARAVKRLKEIAIIKPIRGRLLDVGASFGIFLEEAKKQGWDVYANEFNNTVASYLRKKGFNIFEGDYLKLKEKASSFDVVCLWDVLEHLESPHLALQTTRKILNKDGLLALQLPNIGSLSAKIAGNKWGWLTPPDHLYHFTPKTLGLILHKNGFQIVNLTTFNDQEEIISGLTQRISPSVNSFANIFQRQFALLFKPLIMAESKFLLSGLIVAYAQKA